MLQTANSVASHKTRALQVTLASSASEILAAQKLRWRVFADEMGARLNPRSPGIDQDHFDAYCQHLIVRDEAQGRIVGTYRILSPANARKIGGYYTENEFDLTRLQHLRPRLVEVGRSCVHPDYRSGATITLLWSGLARYMLENGYEYLVGCASISMADGGHAAATLYNQLEAHLSPLEYRVFPRCPLPLEALRNETKAETPPLIKGYLRAGAWICGEPCLDEAFNCADVLILMDITRLNDRYLQRFIHD